MALAGSARKHVSSSGVPTLLGASPLAPEPAAARALPFRGVRARPPKSLAAAGARICAPPPESYLVPSCPIPLWLARARLAARGSASPARPSAHPLFLDAPSNEARLPAELKHITKRRRRN